MSYDFDSIAGSFAAAGIRHAFGVTGSGASLRLIESLQGQGVDYYPAIHESAAGLMAGAACHDGRTSALAITIKGPGFANLVPALLSNRYEGRPGLSVSEAYGDDANPWQAHKRLDHQALCGALVKARIGMDAGGAAIASLSRLARAELPGPCHIDLAATPTGSAEPTTAPPADDARGSLETVLRAIRHSRRPMVVLGSWATRLTPMPDWSSLTVPVATTAAAKGAVDENGEHAAGIITGERGELSPETNIFPGADLVIGFGLRNREVVKAAPGHCPLVAIDACAMEAPEGFGPAHELTAPTASGLAQILAALGEFQWGGEEIREWRHRIDQRVLADGRQAGQAFRTVQDTLADRGHDPRLVLDTGFFCTVGETVWRCRRPGDYVGSAVGRYMGVSIPTAIGLAIADRSRPVVCAVGDGGIGGAIAELRMAVTEKLPLLLLCLSDGGYGSVAAFAAPEPAIRRATEFADGQWWKVARGLGVDAAKVDTPDGLSQHLSRWDPASGPLFLQLGFEPGTYREIARLIR